MATYSQCHNCLLLSTYISQLQSSYQVCYESFQAEAYNNWHLTNERQLFQCQAIATATMVQQTIMMLKARQIELAAYASLEEAYLELRAEFECLTEINAKAAAAQSASARQSHIEGDQLSQ